MKAYPFRILHTSHQQAEVAKSGCLATLADYRLARITYSDSSQLAIRRRTDSCKCQQASTPVLWVQMIILMISYYGKQIERCGRRLPTRFSVGGGRRSSVLGGALSDQFAGANGDAPEGAACAVQVARKR